MDLLVPDSLPSEIRKGANYQNLVTGQVLFHYRDSAKFIFALEIGRIRLVRYTCEGRIVVFQVVRAGESFALSALFSETYLCNAIAEIPSRVISYPKPEILQALQTQPDLAISFLQNSCHKNHSLKTRLELQSISSARDRLLQYLLTEVGSGENNITFDRTYKDIASELGLSPETLYRNIAELEKEGIICRTGRKIELITPKT